MTSANPDAGFATTSPLLSASPSVASDTYSISSLGSTYPSYLASAQPFAEYISQANASQIATQVQEPRRLSDPADDHEGVERPISVVSAGAIALFNSFLDKLLFDILSSARSTDVAALRQAVLVVLRKSLARDAIAAADENLQDLLALDDDDDQVDADNADAAGQHRPDSAVRWNQETTWKRARLRVMMRCEQSDFDIEDDERCAQEILTLPSRNTADSPVKISLSTEIFLAGALDFVAEHFVTLAVPAAIARARRRSQHTKAAMTAHVLVDEPDIEKAILNSPLDRAWRSWRKSLRQRPYSSASQRLHSISATNSHNSFIERERSASLNSMATSTNDDMPRGMPGEFVETPGEWRQRSMPNIPEHQFPEHMLAANVPLPPSSHGSDRLDSSKTQEPVGSEYENYFGRRQSGPVPRNVFGVSMRQLLKQRSASLPTNMLAAHNIDPALIDGRKPSKLSASHSQHTQPDSASYTSNRLSDASGAENSEEYGTAEIRTATGISPSTAALVRTRVSRERMQSDPIELEGATDRAQDNRMSAESAMETELVQRNPNREAAVGMAFPDSISMPEEGQDGLQVLSSRPESQDESSNLVPDTSSHTSDELNGNANQTPREFLQSRNLSTSRSPTGITASKDTGPLAAINHPDLVLRTRAGSRGKSPALSTTSSMRGDSLRRKAVENNTSIVAIVDENNRVNGRSPVVGSSISSAADFDSLMRGADTIKMTLSPQSVREITPDAESTRSSMDSMRKSRSLKDEVIRKKSTRRPTLETVTSNGNVHEAVEAEQQNKRKSLTRPLARNNSSSRSGRWAREASVQTHSTQDFADFIRSTGPGADAQPAASVLPSGDKTPTLGGPGRSPLAKATDDKMSPAITPRAGLRIPSRFKAREAKGADGGASDLIDFLRSEPGSTGTAGVNRTIAPFRTTMDSDELRAMTDKVNGSIVAGTPGSSFVTGRSNRGSISTMATSATYNSRAPLVQSSLPQSSSVISNISSTNAFSPRPRSPAKPIVPSPALSGVSDDGRKRYRNKDIYALPSDDEDDEEYKEILNKAKSSSSQTATNGDMGARFPEDPHVVFNALGSNAPGPTGLALAGVSFNASSSASPGPTDPSDLHNTSNLSPIRTSSKPKLEVKSPGTASKSFKAANLQESTRQTRDLADFLRSSEPPDDVGIKASDATAGDAAPGPVVGQVGARLDSRDGKKGGGKFWKRKRNADLP